MRKNKANEYVNIVYFIILFAVVFFSVQFEWTDYITGYYVVTGGGGAPTITGTEIYNQTPVYFNESFIGYGNYTDDEEDDSGGCSTYEWIVDGIVNKTGTTGQLLLCYFDYVHNCTDNESAFTNNILTNFNDSTVEKNVSFTEKNDTLVYLRTLKDTVIISAVLNLTGNRYGDGNDELIYSSLDNESKSDGTSETDGGAIGGVSSSTGIDSWIIIDSPVSKVVNQLEIKYGEAYNTPSIGNFHYSMRICQAEGITEFADTTDPDGNCSGSYTTVKYNFNLSNYFNDTSNVTFNLSFDNNVSYTFDSDNDYIIKFEYLSGDTGTNRFWRFRYDDNPQILSYMAWENPSYNFGKGLPGFKFYMTSNYSDFVAIDVGNDGDFEFNSSIDDFDTQNLTSNFSSEIQDFLSTCIDDSAGYCDIPINVSVDSSGKITLNSIEVNYPHVDDGLFGKGAPFNKSFTLRYNSTNNFNSSLGTLEMWVMPWWDGNNDSEHYFFDEQPLDERGDRVYVKKNSTHLIFGVDDKINSSNIVSYDINSWNAREWHLVIATWDLDNGEMDIYTDGVLRESLSSSAIEVNATGDFIYIGSDTNNNSQAESMIDELRISEYKKSADELDYYYSINKSYLQNSVYLNLSSEKIIRNSEVILQLTPCDTSQNGSSQNSSTLIVDDFAPSIISLEYPGNGSYISNLTEMFLFNWSDSSDLDGDSLTYYLEIDDNAGFSSPEFTNRTIDTNYTYLVGGLAEGNYSLRVLATDSLKNSSWSQTREVSVDYSVPSLLIIQPANNSISYSEELYFSYNTSDSIGINQCSIEINGTVNQTETLIVNESNSFDVNLIPTEYEWNITCWDNALNTNSSVNIFNVFSSDEFSISNLNDSSSLGSFDNFYIENEFGKINFSESVNLSEGLDLNEYVNISYNRIEVDSGNILKLNKSANLTLNNLTFSNPRVLKDGIECNQTCSEISYNSTTRDFAFNITGFTVYSAEGTPEVIVPVSLTGPGGSTSGGSLKKKSSFEVSNSRIKSVVKEYSIKDEKISVINTGQTTLIFEISHNMPNVITLKKNVYVVKPKTTEEIHFDVNGNAPGIFGGKIFLKAGSLQKAIPIIVEVETEKALFDAKVDIAPDYENIYEGKDLKTQITLLNVGESKKLDVTIVYMINDFDGNKMDEESETFAVEGQKSFTKIFKTSELKAGKYIAGIKLIYGGEVATSSVTFNILERNPVIEREDFLKKNKYYITITIIIFILIMLIAIERTNLKKLINARKRLLKEYDKNG